MHGINVLVAVPVTVAPQTDPGAVEQQRDRSGAHRGGSLEPESGEQRLHVGVTPAAAQRRRGRQLYGHTNKGRLVCGEPDDPAKAPPCRRTDQRERHDHLGRVRTSARAVP